MKKKTLILLLPLVFFLFSFLVAMALHHKKQIKEAAMQTREVLKERKMEAENLDAGAHGEYIWESLTRHLLLFNP